MNKSKIQWHTAPELPKVGDKCILVRDGEIDEAIWECQEDNPESPYMPWVTSTESDHYTTNYPRVNAWIRVKELDASHHEQFDNNRNLSQETANCDKRFDKILEMNTEAERRKIVAMALQGLLANTAIYEHKLKDQFEGNVPFDAYTYLADMAVFYADALIAELNKKKDE